VAFSTPTITDETAEGATATTVVKLTTTDERLSELPLKLTLVKHEGWFVCEVNKG
jgi:hypothetical protein